MEQSRSEQTYHEQRENLAGWNEPGHVSVKPLDRRLDTSRLRDDGCLRNRIRFRGCVLVVAFMVWGCLYSLHTNYGPWALGWHITLDMFNPAYILTKHVILASPLLLQVFQVYPPVRTGVSSAELQGKNEPCNATVSLANDHVLNCERTLLVHSFAYSYGQPFVGSCHGNLAPHLVTNIADLC